MKKFLSVFSVILVCLTLFSVSLFFVKVHNKDNGDTNQVYEIDFSCKTYIALGDSLTQGVDVDMSPYCSMVGEILNFRKVFNYGIGGSTVSICHDGCIRKEKGQDPMSIRYIDMIDNADIVSVMCGTNDWIFSHPFGTIGSEDNTTFYGALKALCLGLKQKYPKSYVFFITPYRNNIANIRNGKTMEDVSNIIKEVCSIYDIPVLDLYSLNDFEPETNSSDGLHPNANFYRTHTAPQIAQFIKDNYKQK